MRDVKAVTASSSTARLRHIDVAKGFGIILVVQGHLSGFLFNPIFLVHMPLFFLIAGLLSRDDPSVNLQRRFFSIAIPYIVFLSVLWVLPAMYLFVLGDIDRIELIKQMAQALIGGEALIGVAAVFWFPSVYAFMLIFAALIAEQSRSSKFVTILGAFSVSLAASIVWPEFFLPLALNVVPIAFAFYWIGRAFRKHDFGRFSIANVMFLVVGAIALLGAELEYWPSIEMKRAEYGIAFFSLLLSAVGVLGILVVSSILSKVSVSRSLAYIGKASLFIMYAHMAVSIPIESSFDIHSIFLVVITLSICLLLYELVRLSNLLSFLFLGKLPLKVLPLHKEHV